MKKTKTHELRRIVCVSALALAFAATAFIGVNDVVFAAATQPETIPQTDDIKSAEIITDVLPDGFKVPTLNVIWNENEGYDQNQPKADTMSYEEAAEIGARYIFDMYGESIDGKTVKMLYSAWPFSTKTYWHGTVANSEDDLTVPELSKAELVELIKNAAPDSTVVATGDAIEALYDFSIDAVTGERVSINSHPDIPTPTNLGEGKTYTLSPVQMEAMQFEAPANVAVYADVARAFAQKHFSHSTVASVEFHRISLNTGDRAATKKHGEAYRKAYEDDKNKPFTFTLYEKGRDITFNVTDSTGRVANVTIDIDTKQITFFDTSGSDFVPGYSYEGEGGVG